MDNYGQGQIFELRATDPVVGTSSAETLSLHVVRELKVGFGRQSQVLVALIPERSEHVVVKFYDPTLNPAVDLRDWPNGRKEFCDKLQSSEAQAYRKLESLQGHGIPRFEGEYYYRRRSEHDCPCFRYKANLLELVPGVSLAQLDLSSFTADQRSTLKSDAFRILDKMHELGIYHHDLIASNLLWDGKSVTIIDFENATFRDDNAETLIDEWVKLDEGELLSTPVDFVGIEDPRPSHIDTPLGWHLEQNGVAQEPEQGNEIIWPSKFTGAGL